MSAVKITAHFDAARIGNTLDRLSIASHKTLAEVLQQQGKLAAAEFINIMPPMLSLSGKDTYNAQRKLGMAAIDHDVRSAYTTVGDVYQSLESRHAGLGAAFYEELDGAGVMPGRNAAGQFVKRGTHIGSIEGARQLMIKYADPKFSQATIGPFNNQVYNRWRSRNTGRIHIQKYPRAVVTDPAALAEFIKMLQQRVGILKAGSYAAAWQAGFAVNVPQWISAHPGSGTGVAMLQGAQPYIRLTNSTPYADHHNRDNRLLTAVLGNRARAMERTLESEAFRRWAAVPRWAA